MDYKSKQLTIICVGVGRNGGDLMVMDHEYYDENTPINLGKYLFTRIKNIPLSYIAKNFTIAGTQKLREYLQNYVTTTKSSEARTQEFYPCPKKPFMNIKEAKERAVFLNNTKRLKNENRTLRVYQCEKCGFFHLTHKLK